MNYGKFFRLNNAKSNLSNGITCYDYIWLCDNEMEDISKFPVYVTISKDSIDFHAHYHDDYEINGKPKHKHSHNTILSLPLSANIEIKDGLTSALVEGYKTNFPRYDKEGSSYLWKLHWKTFWKNRNQSLDVSYFGLDAFFVSAEKEIWKKLIKNAKEFNKETDYIKEIEKKAKENKDHEKINRFIRKLILDFLFDLEHTKVFQTSPHYEHIAGKFNNRYIF